MDVLMGIVDTVFGFAGSLPGWLWIVIVLGIPGILMFRHLRWWIRRGPQWDTAALELGFSSPPEGTTLPALFPSLGLCAEDFEQSPSDALWIIMGRSGGFQVWVGDQRRRMGSKVKSRTVCILRIEGAAWPSVRLIERRGRIPRREEAALPEAGGFEGRLEVVAPDPESARRLLEPAARTALLRLASRSREIERTADPWWTRIVSMNASDSPLEIEISKDVFAIGMRHCLNPAAAKDLLAAAQEACLSVPRQF
jgi:hypothetical protein